MDKSVAVIGIGCRFPDANTPHEFWTNILEGKASFRPIPEDRWDHRAFHSTSQREVDKTWTTQGAFIEDIRSFSALHYGVPPRRLEVMDPQYRLLIESTREAIQDAGYETVDFDRSRVGVYTGISVSEYKNLLMARVMAMGLAAGSFGPAAGTDELRSAIIRLAENTAPIRAFSIPGVLSNMGAATIAQVFDLNGPAYSLDAACAAASAAIFDGVSQLRAGLIDMAIAGGAYLNLTPENLIAFTKVGAISPSGTCRPFDASADGFVQGEGIGVLLLKRLEDALRDGDAIHAVIRGAGCNNDGRSDGPMTPRVEGQLAALRMAYADAEISPATVAYFEAHGTGTTVGDPVEVEALGRLLVEAGVDPDQKRPIGSVKGNVGHTMSAAGLAGIIKGIKLLEHQVAPPHAGFEKPHPALGLEKWPLEVLSSPRPLANKAGDPLRVGVSSFGFGGTNVHFVLEEAPTRARRRQPRAQTAERPEAILVSAPTLALLAGHLVELAGALEGDLAGDSTLLDVAFTLNAHRKLEAVRAVFSATSKQHLIASLRSTAAAIDPESTLPLRVSNEVSIYEAPEADEPPRLAFLFPGQGAQKVGLLGDIRARFDLFDEAFARLDRAVADVVPRPLASYLWPKEHSPEAEAALTATEICQPAMAAASLSLLSVLEALNVRPDVSLGHSLGEFTALASGRIITNEDAVRLVALRGKAMAELPLEDNGAMAAALASKEVVQAAIEGIDGVCIANLNHPGQLSISGTTAAVAEAVSTLSARGVDVRPLSVSHAFHSPLLEGVAQKMRTLVDAIEIRPPSHDVASCISEHPYSSDEASTKAVMIDHATAPVDFVRGLEQARAHGASIFVQVGAGSVLTGFARATLGREGASFVPLCPRTDDDGLSFSTALATLRALGVDVRLLPLYQGEGPTLVELPATPLERAEYWVIKPEAQPIPRLKHPLPKAANGDNVVLVDAPSTTKAPPMSDSDPTHAGLIELFRKQAEVLSSHAEIIAAQNRLLLGEETSAPRVARSEDRTSSAVSTAAPPLRDTDVPSRAAHASVAPPTPEAVPSAASDSAKTVDADQVRERVFEVVAKVSAFPKKSIRAKQRLVDELGFDSIMVADLAKSLEAEFDNLGGLPQTLFSQQTTVADLCDHVARVLEGGVVADDEVEEAPLSVYRVVAAPVARVELPIGDISGQHWLVVADGSELASAISAELKDRGAELLRVELVKKDIPPPERLPETGHAVWPLRSIDGLGAVTSRSALSLDGFVFVGGSANAGETHGFAHHVPVLHPLARSLKTKRFFVVTTLGGKLGLERSEALSKHGSQAALLGYTKALSRERTADVVRALDVSPDAPAAHSAKWLADEMLSADRTVEVGFDGTRRIVPELVEDSSAPVAVSAIGPEDVVLITGGAGQIGSLVARQIAAAKPKGVVLLGRRERDRGINELLAALGAKGTKAAYERADLSGSQSLAPLEKKIRAEIGPVTIVVHAAGAIEDGRAEDKSLDSVRRVMDVKIQGLGAVLSTFRSLRALLIFSSWAGRFGNAGQVDYSAANDLVDRVAVSGVGSKVKALAIDWPPWSSTKMVASIPEAVKGAMKAEGVTFVSDEEGLSVFSALLASQAQGIRVVGRALPSREVRVEIEESISLDSHPYLADHRLEGEPILPLAAATDYVAWAAREALGWEGAITIEDLQLIRGIRAPTRIQISASGRKTPDGGLVRVAIAVEEDDKMVPAYRATVRASAQTPSPVALNGPHQNLPFDVPAFYAQHTFHGPMLQGITSIDAMTDDGMIGTVRGAPIAQLIRSPARSGWSIDPVLMDSALQLAGYWAKVKHGKSGYPIGFERLVQLRRFPKDDVVATVSLADAGEDRFVGNVSFSTRQGELIARIDHIEGRFRGAAETQAPAPQSSNGAGIPKESWDIASFPEVETLEQRLEMAKLIGLDNPFFPVHSGTARNRSEVNGVEMLNYSSYNYLGFSGRPEVVKAAQDAIAKYGTSVSASRIASGERPIHRELELGIAEHIGVDDSIVFTAGHATNVMTIGHMLSSEDLVLHDSLAHDSILSGIKLSGAARRPYPHENLDALERTLGQLRSGYRRALICAEGIYSMDGDICNLPRLIELKKKYKCLLLIDEAHSAGVLGPCGRGVAHHFEGVDPRDVDLWMGTLSKSYASCGGYIAGSERTVRYLKYTAGGFVYSAGITPPNCAAALESLRLMKKHPELTERLRANSKLFLNLAKEKGIDTGHAVGAAVVPAIIGNSMECMQLSAALGARKINVQPIVYPAVEDDSARLRFFISATHTEAEIRETVDILVEELDRIRKKSDASAPSISL